MNQLSKTDILCPLVSRWIRQKLSEKTMNNWWVYKSVRPQRLDFINSANQKVNQCKLWTRNLDQPVIKWNWKVNWLSNQQVSWFGFLASLRHAVSLQYKNILIRLGIAQCFSYYAISIQFWFTLNRILCLNFNNNSLKLFWLVLTVFKISKL